MSFLEVIIKILVILLVFSALAGFGTYLDRKFLGLIQKRLGPTHVGPWGLLQVLADGIKLFLKEDILPQNSNMIIFRLAPIIAVATAFIAMAPIPFLPEFEIFGKTIRPIVSDINVGILFVLSVSAVGMYGPLLAGMSSGSKYSLIGAARAVSQLLSFEVVSGLSILAPIMIVGSLSLIDINNYQSQSIFDWLIFSQPIAFVLFLIAGYAETNRTPFDLLEHEAEIVSGYITEYSGLKWGIFFIGEYANMFTLSFIVSIIFFGGFNPIGFVPGGIAILLKVAFFIFLFIWVRATLPHIRPDQLMSLCWKVLMPIAIINILITGFIII
ncbi:NADH-quinone oxidoreductase subunit NuoH [Helicobacter sp. MIT 14-3879]|uniref:NADH-quinone oxidoreductase subunit NuoH n=1 Tax=Helicobacter sp. MIT 14-3879 TaxID=2040649 RepID=UPI000E1E9159|nr:NADH-quinone oxidoreductase subunit NuoH [Helicobacter sp. MIT 14-3879]RDU63942.1 NADH-quinone oxidoreductase subunit NuoH [Helicobacter sp. MIT 14-3879]